MQIWGPSFAVRAFVSWLLVAGSGLALAQQPGAGVFESPATGSIKHASRTASRATVPSATGRLGMQPLLYHDDPDNSTPTAWWIYSGQSPTDVSNTVNADNARIIDISVESFSPSYSFTVTYVQNTESYSKGWSWYYGIDATTLSNYLSTNNARPISLKAYDIGGGQIRFAVAMVLNTGADQKTYWWYYGLSSSQVGSYLSTNNARLTTLQSYTSNGQTLYAVTMIANTGADAKAWWWYFNQTAAQVSSNLSVNNARPVDLTSAGNGNFNVVMESCSDGCPAWWWYYGVNLNQLLTYAQQNNARIISADAYPGCGGFCYASVLIDDSDALPPNANAITQRVGSILQAGGVGGVQGLYLKQVSGSVLANWHDSYIYEPASSIKVVAHLYAMTQLQNGGASLSEAITHYTNGPDSCPDPPSISGTEPLSTALQEMMWHSDNARTREITDTFGDSNINAFAHSLGMSNTNINHIIGCGGPIPDQFSQDDAAKLYEGVANGTLLNSATRATFYSLMAGKAQYEAEGYDWTGIWDTDVPNIINQEAPAGTTTAQKQAYQNSMDLAYKAGSYEICISSGCSQILEHLSLSGWFKVPFCAFPNSVITSYNEYVFGVFLSNAPDNSWYSGKTTVADTNFTNAKGELLREQVRAGLVSCYATGGPQIQGSLQQVSVGSDGTVWGLNSSEQIFMYNAETASWQNIPGALAQIAVGSNSSVWGINAGGAIYRWDASAQAWDQIPGNLSQIAVGADGDVWGLNSASQIYHYNSAAQDWTEIPGALTQLAAGSDGAVWGINAEGAVYRFNPGTQLFEAVTGSMKQIAAGADGDVWGINSADQVYHFNRLTQNWDNIPGALVQISVGLATNVWGVNSAGNVYYYDTPSQSWIGVSGILSKISAAADGAVWGVDSSDNIYQFRQPTTAAPTWHQIPGALTQISAGVDGNVWGINSANQIWAFNPLLQNWEQIPGELSQVAVGFGGEVWGLNSVGQIWRYDPSIQNWDYIPGSLTQIAVGAKGDVWGINSAEQIYRYDRSIQSWDYVPGFLVQISVGADGDVWGVNGAQEIYKFDSVSQSWMQTPGSLSQIAVGSVGNEWGINSQGSTYLFNSQAESWSYIPGVDLTKIAVGFDGSVWGLNSAGQIFQFNTQTQGWASVSGSLSQIVAAGDAVVWGLDASGSIYTYH